MEPLVYWMVKVMAAVYLLYRTVRFLYWTRKQHYWRFLNPKEKAFIPPPKQETTANSLVGKSQTIYLKEAPQEKSEMIKPVFSEDLERNAAYEEEPDITAEDVEDSLDRQDLSEEDRFTPLETVGDNGGISTGMTFEQLADTLDVVQGKKTGTDGLQAAARILYEIRGSNLFDFLAAQAENEQVIERLLRENLDDAGNPLPETGRKRRKMEAFDMNKYV